MKTVKYYYTTPLITFSGIYLKDYPQAVIAESKIKPGIRYTFAAVYDEDSKTIKFGMAKCNPEDKFVKAIGREIAEKHAETNPFYVIENFSGIRNDYADEVMEVMLKQEAKLLKRDYPGCFNDRISD